MHERSLPAAITHALFRRREHSLALPELIAIALGGMVGGGIFSILGVAVARVGVLTPLAIALGGSIAACAAYSYVKLGVYYKDEGATYSFFKRTYPGSHFAASLIGWWVVFGYISTLALYAFTFASYAISGSSIADDALARRLVAGGVLAVFAIVNVWSVRGMGRVEDLLVYTKLVVLAVISFVLINHGQATWPELKARTGPVSPLDLLIVASVTFVAYEGFQLVINAVEEIAAPARQIPRAIYSAIFLAVVIYIVIAVGAIVAIPFDDLVRDREYALAAGAKGVIGNWGTELVIFGALLATCSAISGTMFGASRLLAVIARDGYFPSWLARRRGHIPVNAILAMTACAWALVLVGDLEVILEFGSITFLLVSVLMCVANFKIRHLTGSSAFVTVLAMVALTAGGLFILYYEWTEQRGQLLFIGGLYLGLTVLAWAYARFSARAHADAARADAPDR